MQGLDQRMQKSDFDQWDRLKTVTQYGVTSLSYSSLQEGMKDFRHPGFKGFIAYCAVGGFDYVLGDPLTPSNEMLTATMLFLQDHPKAVFCQISHHYASVLNCLNFKINSMGVENFLNLRDFRVGWKSNKCLKSYLSKLSKEQYYVFEFKANPQEVWGVNQQWLDSKGRSKELRFMARPFVGVAQEDVRYFYLIRDQKILGFATFDPIYSDKNDGKIVSYVLQHIRVAKQAPLGASDYLILNAIFQFKEEGIKELSLGISPLYERRNTFFPYSHLLENVLEFIYKRNLFYNYQGLGQHKDYYRPYKRQCYLASRGSLNIGQFLGLLRVNNLI